MLDDGTLQLIPKGVDDCEERVRMPTWRNESGEAAHSMWVRAEDGQVIVGEASGLRDMDGTPLPDGEEVSSVVGFGVAVARPPWAQWPISG